MPTSPLPRRLAPSFAPAFAPALAGEFVSWDDAKNFLENAHYRGLGPSNLAWMWTTFHLGHYIPLSWMSLGLDYVLWGMNPAGYHATSIVIHAANAVVLNDTQVPSGAIAAGVPAVVKPGKARVADIESGVRSYLGKTRRYRESLRRIG